MTKPEEITHFSELHFQRFVARTLPLGAKPTHPLINITTIPQTHDVLFTSQTRTETIPEGIWTASKLLVSKLGMKIAHQNPNFLRRLLILGDWPQYQAGCLLTSTSDSLVRMLSARVDGQTAPLVIKYHNEGSECYEHFDREALPDRITGIENFLALRAISLLYPDLLIPDPVLATQKVFVSRYIEGNTIEKGKIPKWVKDRVSKSINYAHELGWLRRGTAKRFGPYLFFGYVTDLDAKGNVLLTEDGSYCIVDPIA